MMQQTLDAAAACQWQLLVRHLQKASVVQQAASWCRMHSETLPELHIMDLAGLLHVHEGLLLWTHLADCIWQSLQFWVVETSNISQWQLNA